MINKYFFYPPNHPQFYFPKNHFKEFKNYYTPYSIKGKLLWFLFAKLHFKIFFICKEDNIPIPIASLKKIIKHKDGAFFYNIGTLSNEQKTTVVYKGKDESKFLKFAQKPKSKKLVENEISTLLMLEKNPLIKTPKVLNQEQTSDFVYVLTEVVDGEKLTETHLTDEIFKLALKIANLSAIKEEKSIFTFSHGDFCSWNILVDNSQELIPIDWEMASYKPLGYDLFTFIFQTNFLLSSNKSIKDILLENNIYITRYFNEFNVRNWYEYLITFAKIKTEEEQKKLNQNLYYKYLALKNHYE